MKILIRAVQVLLGAIFVVRVLLPEVAAGMRFPPAAQAWLDIMKATGYLQTLLYVTELCVGAALIVDLFVPLALIALAPIIANITLFHVVLDGRWTRIVQVILMLGAYLLLVYDHRRSFAPLFYPAKPPVSGFTARLFNARSVLRIILGLAFFLPGMAKLLIPDQLSLGDLLIDGMKSTGYLYTLLGVTEVLIGISLLAGRFVPFALAVSAPITLNILLYHAFIAPAGLPIGLAMTAIQIALVTVYADAYRSITQRRAS